MLRLRKILALPPGSALASLWISPLARALLCLTSGIVLIHLAFLKPIVWGLDGNEVLQVAYSLVTHHSLSVPSGVGGVVGADGQSYSSRYILLPVLLTPIVAIAASLSDWIGLPALQIAAMPAVATSVVLTAATAAMVVLLALRLGSSYPAAYVSAICYAFGTIALTYAQTLFSEPLLGFLLITCLYLAFGQSQRAWFGCSLLATLAILAKPTAVVIAPLISLYFLAKRYPLRAVLGPILLPALGVVGYGGYNYLRFGSVLETGQPVYYGWNSTEMAARFWGFLFGWGIGGGLIWYCPPVILAVIGFYKALRSKPLEALTLFFVGLSFLALHSHWWCCGWDWGPRFLVPILPLLMALTALLDYRGRQGLMLLSVAGFVISAPTLVAFYQRYYWELELAGREVWKISLWTDLSDAPLVRVWGAAYRQISDAIATDVQAVLAAGELSGLTKIVPVWWWMLPVMGLPVWMGAITAVGMVAIGIVLLKQGWKQLE